MPRRLLVLLLVAFLGTGCAAQGSTVQRPGTPAPRPSMAVSAHASVAAAPGPVAAPSMTAVPAAPTACEHNTHRQLVAVSLRRQHLWMCAGHTLVRDTAITSGIVGRYTSTPTGTYTVQGRTRHTTLTLNTGQTYRVHYWIPFDAPLFGFHDAPWQTFPYGSARYRIDGSHGCVHMPLPAIAFLYRWADVGATVRIAA